MYISAAEINLAFFKLNWNLRAVQKFTTKFLPFHKKTIQKSLRKKIICRKSHKM